jgi:hypothetical protein
MPARSLPRVHPRLARSYLWLATAVAACASPTASGDDPEPQVNLEAESLAAPGRPSLASDAVVAEAALARAACAISVTAASQLMITNLGVVNDAVRTQWSGSLADPADGAWSFGRLMSEMAGAHDSASFVRSWLSQFQHPLTINQETVPPNPHVNQFLAAWPRTPAGALDLAKAPLRLLAIANRFDLRSAGNAGELRFVFGFFTPTDPVADATVILEYEVPAATAAEVTAYAKQWSDLGALALGSPAYRAALQAITDRVTRRGRAPAAINGSAISQVRTNIFIEGAEAWDLREFRLTTAGQLRGVSPALTPSHAVSPSNLAAYMLENAAAIKAQVHVVPALFHGTPFAAGVLLTAAVREAWNAPGITDSTLRHRFSVNTCNGCHSLDETATFAHHVPNRRPDKEAVLSSFLTGVTVPDPFTSVPRSFHELATRARILDAYLCAHP